MKKEGQPTSAPAPSCLCDGVKGSTATYTPIETSLGAETVGNPYNTPVYLTGKGK